VLAVGWSLTYAEDSEQNWTSEGETVSQGGAPATKATPKEEYELLYETMKDFHQGIIDFEFKHGVVLSVIVGWFITSDRARDFIAKSSLSAVAIILVMILLTIFHFIWVRTYSKLLVTRSVKLIICQ
jgi:hypothetical protein